MEKEIFKIKGIGLDVTKTNYAPFPLGAECIFTNLTSMNENVVKELAMFHPGLDLITYTDYLDGVDRHLLFHAQQLERRKINLLLVSSKCDFNINKEVLKSLMEMGLVDHVGVYAEIGTTTADLEKIKESLDFKVVGMEINPKNFPKSLISWCETAGDISIFGFNPVPDQETIEEYSLPYLLSLASVYSNVVILGKNDIQESRYLKYLCAREIENKKIYNLKEAISPKKVKKQIMHPYLKFNGVYLPALPEDLYDEVEISKGKRQTKKPKKVKDDKAVEAVIDLFNDKYVPADRKDTNHISDFLPTAIHKLQLLYPDYNLSYAPVGKNTVVIDVYREKKKRLFRKTIEADRKTYILHVTDEDKIMFTIATSES